MKVEQRATEGRTKTVLSDKDTLLKLYREMLLIRRFEEKTAEMYQAAKIGGFCHLNIGEEATIVGTISALQPKDYVYSTYREHGHALAKGIDARAVMAELFGKETGTSHGRGGSMHLFSQEHRFYGGYAIVGQALPIACGSGYAINYQGTNEVVMSIFGDGATNIGAFHEALNVAKLWHLPIVFVCVNNLYGMGTAVSRASAVTEIWKKACAYDMTGERVDGMDVLAVRRISDQLVAQAREHHEPSLLECVTYRYRGHSMSDPDTYRGKDEIKEWQTRDAILSLGEHMKKEKMLTDDEIQQIDEEVTAQVEDAVKFADESPDPDPKDLYRNVYADEVAS
ncbi:MAG TPA: pyruvate dehydrogenase (acetyl-transferring) E1 component subunit alpha [Candidatus Dormibacteraeota bacterium]|nr:pyruvate dehydrogenase (acetyl-transferring) E1 component subunit alpha [Candidatus Dormibacteraeota bacterium]